MKSSKIILPILLAATMVGTTAYSTTAVAMDGKMGGCGMMGGSEMGPMMPHMGMGAIHPGMIKHIKGQLKPEQMAQFDAALKDYSKKIEPTQQALFVKHEELKALQHATNPDVKAVSKTATEFVQLVSKLKSEREAFEDKITKDFGIKGSARRHDGWHDGWRHDEWRHDGWHDGWHEARCHGADSPCCRSRSSARWA